MNRAKVTGFLIVLLVSCVSAGVIRAEESEATRSGRMVKQEIKKKVVDEIRRVFPRAAIGRGKLTNIDGVNLMVDHESKVYKVLTGTFDKCATKFVRRFGGTSSLAEFTVGDEVGVVGRWQDDSKTVVEACVVRDLSIQKRRATFVGEVKSVSTNGFVMSTVSEARSDQTVTVSSTTKIVNRREQTIALSEIQVGHRIRVKGLWNNLNNTVMEVVHVKDYSLPVRSTPTPSTTP